MRKRILIVDDDVCASHILRTKLERAGDFEVIAESVSTRALPLALAFRPDFIVLDVCMPHLDGGDVAAQIQAEPTLCKTPIVFLTSLVGEDENMVRPMLSGGFHFIGKPVDGHRLAEYLMSRLGARAGEAHRITRPDAAPCMSAAISSVVA